MKKLFLLIILLPLWQLLHAQELSSFSLENVVTGQPVSPATYPSCEGMVIVFTTNNCPYDEYYRARLTKIAEQYNDKVPLLLVNSNADPADTKDNMVKKAKQLNLGIPYLADKDQTLMTALDARKSPEAFLLKNVNGKLKVVYRGAIDDNAQVEADVRRNYLRDAIDIMLTNQQIETFEVRPAGCSLRKKS